MSLFTIKDLNYLIAEQLDLNSLLIFSNLNKYNQKIFNDTFFSILYIKKYSKFISLTYPNITKQEYFENEKALTLTNKEAKGFAITKDRVDLLKLIYYFDILQNKTTSSDKTYLLIDMCIEYDSLNCFKYYSDDKKFDNYFINIAIRFKSDKILQYLFDEGFTFSSEDDDFGLCFENYSCKYIELYISQTKYLFPIGNLYLEKHKSFSNEFIINITYLLNYRYSNICTEWLKNFNPAFSLFVKHLTEKQINEIKTTSNDRNVYSTVKLITKYTSQFEEFSKL